MSAADHQIYVQNKINPLLEPLVTQALLERPDDIALFMVKWLCNHSNIEGPNEVEKLKKEIEALKGSSGGAAANNDDPPSEEESDDDEDDDDVADLPEFNKMPARGPRASVSAEAYGQWNVKKAFTPPEYPKSDEQNGRIRKVLANSFLFAALDEVDMATVVLAMQEKVLAAKERPINQGDDGDVLYVIEEGILDCYKKFDEGDEKLVKTCNPGDVFGELALLYNCPRAASVESRDKSVVWTLDRETFNAIVKDAATKKLDMYEKFLKSVPLLESMDVYERNKIAEALKTEIFGDGDMIVKQGDPGDKFYLLEDGEAVATKAFIAGQTPKEVMQYKTGDYFGELALLKDEPRAANVIAKGKVRCAYLDRGSFKRILGPLEDILKRATEKYEK